MGNNHINCLPASQTIVNDKLRHSRTELREVELSSNGHIIIIIYRNTGDQQCCVKINIEIYR